MFTLVDKSNYLKGLMVLARQDKRLIHNEKEIIRSVAKKFGFSRDFYEDALQNLMSNKYISDEPVIFSSRQVAELFLADGFELALSDNDFDISELKWLKGVALANTITEDEFKLLLGEYQLGIKDRSAS